MAATKKAARQEAREPARPEIRGRDGAVLTRRATGSMSSDQFHVPDTLHEAGWTMQWVRATCLGKDDPSNITDHMENGWRPVNADRPGFKQYFRTEGSGDIVREGLILMERPAALTEQALQEDYSAAMHERNTQVEEFSLSDLPAGFDRGYGKAATKVTRTVEGAPTDSYPQRQLAIGDDD